MVWGLPRCVWARESTAPAQVNQSLSRDCGGGGAPRGSAGSGATAEGLTSRGGRNLRLPLRFGQGFPCNFCSKLGWALSVCPWRPGGPLPQPILGEPHPPRPQAERGGFRPGILRTTCLLTDIHATKWQATILSMEKTSKDEGGTCYKQGKYSFEVIIGIITVKFNYLSTV